MAAHPPVHVTTIAEHDLGVTVTLLGGPTALLEIGGIRLLTDPTFDDPGSYPIGTRSLVKTAPPAWSADRVGAVDAVLLSHDQHPDNLDSGGRAFLRGAPLVLTTATAAQRLGGTAVPLPEWQHVELTRPDGRLLRITGVPAQHGPDGCEEFTGPVTGFVLSGEGVPTVYVSGDNASLAVVRAVADRWKPVDVALLFAGAARTALLGGAFLTLTSDEAAQATRILDVRHVVPLHVEGWEHFTQGPDTLPAAFERAGVRERLRILPLGISTTLYRDRTDTGR
ncbi:MAG: MBL fold metallo-hydrolase [Geodermatophilaceae bacterium]